MSFPAGLDFLLTLTLVLSSGSGFAVVSIEIGVRIFFFYVIQTQCLVAQRRVCADGERCTFTLGAPVFSHDALHGAEDLLGDGRRQGRGVHGAVGTRAEVVHQLLQHSVEPSHLLSGHLLLQRCTFKVN